MINATRPVLRRRCYSGRDRGAQHQRTLHLDPPDAPVLWKSLAEINAETVVVAGLDVSCGAPFPGKRAVGYLDLL